MAGWSKHSQNSALGRPLDCSSPSHRSERLDASTPKLGPKTTCDQGQICREGSQLYKVRGKTVHAGNGIVQAKSLAMSNVEELLANCTPHGEVEAAGNQTSWEADFECKDSFLQCSEDSLGQVRAQHFEDGHCSFHWSVHAPKLRSKSNQIISPPFEISKGNCFKLMLSAASAGDGKGEASFKKAGGQGSVLLKYVDGANALPPTVHFRVLVGKEKGSDVQSSLGPLRHDFDACVVEVPPADAQRWDFLSAVDPDTSACTVSLEILPAITRNFQVYKRSKNNGDLEEWKRLPDYDEALDNAMAAAYSSGKPSWGFNFKSPGSTKRHYTVDFETMLWKRAHHIEEGKVVLIAKDLQRQRDLAIAREHKASQSLSEEMHPSYPPGLWLPQQMLRLPPGLEEEILQRAGGC